MPFLPRASDHAGTTSTSYFSMDVDAAPPGLSQDAAAGSTGLSQQCDTLRLSTRPDMTSAEDTITAAGSPRRIRKRQNRRKKKTRETEAISAASSSAPVPPATTPATQCEEATSAAFSTLPALPATTVETVETQCEEDEHYVDEVEVHNGNDVDEVSVDDEDGGCLDTE